MRVINETRAKEKELKMWVVSGMIHGTGRLIGVELS